MKKTIGFISAVIFSFLTVMSGLLVSAEGLPYRTYFYVDGKEKASPATLNPVNVVNGKEAGSGSWNSPQDIYIDNELIYIADTDNNRITVLDMNYKSVRNITQITDNGQNSNLSAPAGVMAKDGYVYICDTGNARVVKLDQNNNVVLKIEKPTDPIYDQSRVFQPQKIVIDNNGCFYILSIGTYEGALLYNPDGTFNSFYGGNRVTVTFSLLIENAWRKNSQ